MRVLDMQYILKEKMKRTYDDGEHEREYADSSLKWVPLTNGLEPERQVVLHYRK